MKKFNIIFGIILFLLFTFADMRDELTVKAIWSCLIGVAGRKIL